MEDADRESSAEDSGVSPKKTKNKGAKDPQKDPDCGSSDEVEKGHLKDESRRNGNDAKGKKKKQAEEEGKEEELGEGKTSGNIDNGKPGKAGKTGNSKNGNSGSNSGETTKAQQVKDLMTVWLNFQSATKDSFEKIQKLETTLTTLEESLDRFGKFCGEYQLIWKVKNFSQSFELARKGERMIIYSPTFDTHRSGYKLQLSLCPNGDGRGTGVAMSLFFAILKGPYDSLLQWPFVCPVTMTLLEQVSDVTVKQPCDVTMTFMPNPRPDNAPFLGRPEGPKNLSLGFQKFISLTDLYDGEYIQDDSLFIKVYVDISSVMAL